MNRLYIRILLLGLLTGICANARAAACDGQPLCQETASFVVSLSEFRLSKQGNNRIATANLSFQNKSNAPLILGYVKDSAIAIDELGNRYVASDVRGIGLIERNVFDPKFTLQPGERSDARIDLRWYGANQAAGVRFDLDLAVREIESLEGQQFRLGKEHALRFGGLTDGAGGRLRGPAPATVATVAADASTSSTGTAPAPTADPCDGSPRCASNGPLTIDLVQLTTSMHNANHHVRVTLRARNVSSERAIVAYQTNSGVLLDNYGNRYTVDWRYKERVSGIGQTSRDKADPQFMLQPGEARSFTLEYSRYAGKTAVGTVFSPSFVLEQLEILPSQQIRPLRELNFTYSGSTAGTFDAAQTINDAGKALAEGLKSIFKKRD